MSAQIDIDKVLGELKGIVARAGNEEELRINAERILYNEVLSPLGLQPGRYEYTFISGGRADALYGHVLIEYKAPARLSRPSDVAKAKEQLIGYIKREAEVEERYKLFLGVILCDKIAFVRHDAKTKDWSMRGPYDLNRETVLRLIEAIRGLRRKRLAVDELLRDFGPQSEIATKAVKVFYDRITRSKSSKAKALFNDWRRLFSQVCAYSPEKLKGLETDYGIGGHVDYNALLFSIHTYYALIMKLLGAEVAYLYGAGKWLKSYVGELEDAHMRDLDALNTALNDLESGGIFRKLLNITNFMEGDYFSWYLEELDEGVAGVVSETAKRLADYEPATPILEPEYTRDLLKRLYQNLVPKKIRHDLGEYYTPDWLAELVLDEVGLTIENFENLSQEKNDSLAPLNLRVLDPACGSGTFLILTLRRIREYAEEHYLREALADHLLGNVIGFDLNPLAVLAARTNYLLAVADLLSYVRGPIEIPIYLSDSLLVEERTTLAGAVYVIRTYVGQFQIPQSIVERGLLGSLLETIDKYIRLRYKAEEFEQLVKSEFGLSESELRLAGLLYGTFLKLEDEGRDHVWTSVIRNAFAPLIVAKASGGFDFVVGNPPWVNWENLPEVYRDSTKELWNSYGLLEKTKGMGMGKVRRDLASLFVARCFDRYTKQDGILSFLIPFNVLKTQGGAGFREYLGTGMEVIKVNELSELYPFEGVTNRTGSITIRHGKTSFPIKCSMWSYQGKGGVPQELSLNEVRRTTRQFDIVLSPIEARKVQSPWALTTRGTMAILHRVVRRSEYRGFEGLVTALNGAYWVNVKSVERGKLLVENTVSTGKKRVKTANEFVEKELVYPLLRGRDVDRWYSQYRSYVILPVDEKGRTIDVPTFKTKFPGAFRFFSHFFDQLVDRQGEPYKSHLVVLKRKGTRVDEPPFYMLFNAGPALTKFKVVWKNVSGIISAKGQFGGAAAVGLSQDSFLGLIQLVPSDTLNFVPCETEDEAHYVCSLLNSVLTDLIVTGYAILGVRPHLLRYLGIPKFDPKEKLHVNLAELSRKAHELAKKYHEENETIAQEELERIEEDVDKAAARIYGLTDEELEEVKKSLAILRGEETGEEEDIGEEPREARVEFLNAVVRPNIISNFDVVVLNPVGERVAIEIRLPDRLVKLETDKEEDRIQVKVTRLEAGEYRVPYSVATAKGTTAGEFTLYVKEEEKRRVREAFTSRLDELLGD